jgi:hypothetical protein
MSSEGCVWVQQPNADKMVIWRTFFGILTCWVRCRSLLQTIMAVWHASNSNGHFLQRAATPNQITQQNSLQRAGGP